MSLSNPESFRKDIVNPKAEISDDLLDKITLEMVGKTPTPNEVMHIKDTDFYVSKDPTKIVPIDTIRGTFGDILHVGTKLPEYPLDEAS